MLCMFYEPVFELLPRTPIIPSNPGLPVFANNTQGQLLAKLGSGTWSMFCFILRT